MTQSFWEFFAVTGAVAWGWYMRGWFIPDWHGVTRADAAWAVIRRGARGDGLPLRLRVGYGAKALVCMALGLNRPVLSTARWEYLACVWERETCDPEWGSGIEWVGVHVGRGLFTGWAWDASWECTP